MPSSTSACSRSYSHMLRRGLISTGELLQYKIESAAVPGFLESWSLELEEWRVPDLRHSVSPPILLSDNSRLFVPPIVGQLASDVVTAIGSKGLHVLRSKYGLDVELRHYLYDLVDSGLLLHYTIRYEAAC